MMKITKRSNKTDKTDKTAMPNSFLRMGKELRNGVTSVLSVLSMKRKQYHINHYNHLVLTLFYVWEKSVK